MVTLVNPILDVAGRTAARQRATGGPQPGFAPLGEGATPLGVNVDTGQSLFGEIVSGGDGSEVLLGQTSAGGSADLLTGGAGQSAPGGIGPVGQLGLALLTGNNPLTAFREQQALRAQQARQAFQDRLTLAKFQLAQRQAEREEQRQRNVAATLTQIADEAEAAGDPNARGLRLAAVNVNPEAAQTILAARQNKVSLLSDDEIEAAGLPPETVAQRDADGDIDIIFNPSVDSQEARISRALASRTQVNVNTKPQTELAKIEADLEAGRITDEQAKRKRDKILDFTDAQTRTAGHADQLRRSQAAMAEITAGGFDPTDLTTRILQGVPGGNLLQSSEAQQYFTAAEDFAAAVLRRESGAAITADELTRVMRRFFPLPGDKAETVEAKRLRREEMFKSLRNQSGGAYDELFGQDDSQAGAGQQDFTTMRAQDFPEGSVIETETGDRLVQRGGQWVPVE